MGMIPEEWVVERIIDWCDYADYRGKTPPKSQSGTFLVTAKNVRKGFIDYAESQEFVPTELYEQIMRRGKPRIGDVLITTEAPLGNVAQIDREDVALAQRIIKYRPKSSSSLCSAYLKYYLLSDRFQRILVDHSSGSTAKGIKGRVLHQLPLVIPPLTEQRAIAAALGDVDALLDALEKLIAKKRELKQAAMQQLLTGQKRLPGFSGKWEVKRLGDCLLSRPDYGINAPAVPFSDQLPSYIRITDISEHGRFSPNPPVSVSAANADRFYLNEGDLVFARTGASVGKSYLYDNGDGQLVFAGFLIRVKPSREVLVPPFLAAYVTTRSYWNWVRFMSMRSGQPGINGNEYAQLPIPLPTLPEQTAIAEVLSDMDAEIAALEQRLAKTGALKQGMMQELLTRKTRLV